MANQIFIEVTKEELNSMIKKAIEDCLLENHIISKKEDDQLLKMSEACEILQVSKVTIHQWKKQGRIPFHRISNRIFFKRSELLESLKKISPKIPYQHK